MSTSYQEILYDVCDGIATVTMNRPARMNAMTNRMNGEIRDAVATASGDDAVRVIVLTGAGRGFCAGADAARLQASAAGQAQEEPNLPIDGAIPGGLELSEGFGAKYAYLATAPKPTIAAVNGPAVGVGLVMAVYCDVRFASDQVKFSTAFARRGLIPEYGMAWLLPKIIGPGKAFDLIYSSRMVLAGEALAMGLVDYVYPGDELMAAVNDYAGMIAGEISPRSTRIAKELVYRGLSQDLDTAMAEAIEETKQATKTADFKEGIAAWQEKRKPAFTGN